MKKKKVGFLISFVIAFFFLGMAFNAISESILDGILYAISGVFIIGLGNWLFLPH